MLTRSTIARPVTPVATLQTTPSNRLFSERTSFGSIGSEGQHYFRISIATALDDLKVGLERIRDSANDVGGFQNFIKEGKHLC